MTHPLTSLYCKRSAVLYFYTLKFSKYIKFPYTIYVVNTRTTLSITTQVFTITNVVAVLFTLERTLMYLYYRAPPPGLRNKPNSLLYAVDYAVSYEGNVCQLWGHDNYYAQRCAFILYINKNCLHFLESKFVKLQYLGCNASVILYWVEYCVVMY